jgi:hypothetical protein
VLAHLSLLRVGVDSRFFQQATGAFVSVPAKLETPLAFPCCRHGGPELADGVRECRSPKLVGMQAVTPAICGECWYRDTSSRPAQPRIVPLRPCLHFGPALAQATRGKPRAGQTSRKARGENIVHECTHPQHGQTTFANCHFCADYVYPELTPDLSVDMVQRILAQPPRRQPDGWWRWPNVQAAQRRSADELLRRPLGRAAGGNGRGIVIAGGGKYLPSAYVTVRMLRQVGCRLRIELWHLCGEMDGRMRQILDGLGVTCIDADVFARTHPFRFLNFNWWKGWQLKCYALVHSRFREVLFLDADSFPLRDPEFLFDWPGYRDSGAIFWPDFEYTKDAFRSEACALFGIGPFEGLLTESGQMLIDRARCWRELNLALHYNAQADYMYRHIHGDKDTFTVAWQKAGRPYGRMWPTCGYAVHSILQYDDRGQVLFQHRASDKLTLEPTVFHSTPQLDQAGQAQATLPSDNFVHQVLDELRSGWRTWWDSLVALWHPHDPFRPSAEFRRYYQVKHDVARLLKPRTICEIGVRAGYSAFAFLAAAPDAKYLGIDADIPVHGGQPGFFDYARRSVITGNVRFQRCNSQRLAALPGRFDLVHVDGDHSYTGALHDIDLACRAGKHVLVDDYDFLDDVRRACDDFLATRPELTSEYFDDGLRGNLLIHVEPGTGGPHLRR